MSKKEAFLMAFKGNCHPFIEKDYEPLLTSPANKVKKEKENYEEQYAKSYQDALNLCFSEKPQLIKFDANSTDEDIDNFFDSL